MEEREQLLRCCFLVMAADDEIDATESWLANRLAEELDIERPDLNAIREEFHDQLSGVRELRKLQQACRSGSADRPQPAARQLPQLQRRASRLRALASCHPRGGSAHHLAAWTIRPRGRPPEILMCGASSHPEPCPARSLDTGAPRAITPRGAVRVLSRRAEPHASGACGPRGPAPPQIGAVLRRGAGR